jgi:Na+/H+ antiporter NhaC
MLETMGWISLVPIVLAVVLALWTKNTVASLVVACIVGSFLAGNGIWGFTDLLQSALGNEDFVWAALNILLFGVLVAYYEKSGAIDGFTRLVSGKNLKRKGVQVLSWALGLFCFADSMSPLFVGSVMRKLSDRAKISREKLAYIADSTAAPVSVLYPFTGWGSLLTGLAVGVGCITERNDAYKLMLKAIPFNLYAILSLVMVLLLSLGVIKDYGPMKTAEKRAMETGKLVRDGATPLSSTVDKKSESIKERVFLNFVLPSVLLLGISIVCFITIGSVKVLEAVTIIVLLMSVSFLIQGMSLQELNETFVGGVKGATPALLVLAVAYPLNALSSQMGTADYIINITSKFLSPALLPAGIFLICALLSFATGSSWGTYAIAMPLALPIAYSATNNEVTLLVVACFAAVAGGGVFGDHCSPVSDTTIMSSMGAGSDHIDHVKTQLPYALTVAAVTTVLYLIIGFAAA